MNLAVLLDVAPNLATVLGRSIDAALAPPLSPQAARTRLTRTIARLVRNQKRLTILLLDDLQWADAESLELLDQLAQYAKNSALLLIGSYRESEASHELRELPANLRLRLDRLSDQEIAAFGVRFQDGGLYGGGVFIVAFGKSAGEGGRRGFERQGSSAKGIARTL